MKFYKYIYFFYLIVAALFIYDGSMNLVSGASSPWPSFLLAGVAIFMFLFRRRYVKKMEENENKKL